MIFGDAQVSSKLIGVVFVVVFSAGLASGAAIGDRARPTTGCGEEPGTAAPSGFFSRFEKSLDPCTWIAVQENWGAESRSSTYSGGVVPANVGIRDGVLVLSARGNRYDGPVRGFDTDGTMRADGRLTGSAIMTRQRFLGGRFEARVTVPQVPGLITAMWTYYNMKATDGGVENHEIDIEFPGSANRNTALSFDYVTLTTWTGLERDQTSELFVPLPMPVADGNFHTLRFDWHPPTASNSGRVSFYIDDRFLGTQTDTVPSRAGNLWLGLWFPEKWAGIPDFDTTQMRVDWVKLTPFAKAADDDLHQ